MHPEEPDVLIMKDGSLQQKEASTQLRKKGILIENQRQLVEEEPQYQAERNKFFGDKKLCLSCSGFYSTATFHQRQLQCMGDSAVMPLCCDAIVINCLTDKPANAQVFESQILSRMNNDECGTLAKQNPIIRSIE
jgi:hypothetical protein